MQANRESGRLRVGAGEPNLILVPCAVLMGCDSNSGKPLLGSSARFYVERYLRLPNMMVDEELTKVIAVDFGWAGIDGVHNHQSAPVTPPALDSPRAVKTEWDNVPSGSVTPTFMASVHLPRGTSPIPCGTIPLPRGASGDGGCDTPVSDVGDSDYAALEFWSLHAELQLQFSRSRTALDLDDHDRTAAAAANIHMYGRCGAPQRCTEVYSDTARRGALCWTNGHLERARAVLNAMPRGDVYAWNAMLGAYAAASRIDCAATAFRSMPWRSVVSWNAMIAGYAHNGKHDAALLLFRAMDLDGVSPSPVSFVSAMDSCAALVAVAQGRMLHAEATAKQFEADVGVAMYGKFGLLDDALAVFHRAVHRSVVSWNALAAAFAENGRSRDAIAVLWTMLLEAETPSAVSFLIAIVACSHAGLYADGLQHSIAMSNDHALRPGLDHYLCVIDLLGRAGQLRDAEELANAMPYGPDAVAWTAVLGACCNTATYTARYAPRGECLSSATIRRRIRSS